MKLEAFALGLFLESPRASSVALTAQPAFFQLLLFLLVSWRPAGTSSSLARPAARPPVPRPGSGLREGWSSQGLPL